MGAGKQEVHNTKSTAVGLKFPAADGKPAVDLTLNPGMNQVDAKQWAAAKEQKMVQAHLEAKHLVEPGAEEPETKQIKREPARKTEEKS